MKVRKKPIILDAWKISFQSLLGYEHCPDWVWKAYLNDKITIASDDHTYIKALEGIMFAPDGHYLIKGVEDEIYAIDPDIFEKTYEVVEDDA